MNYNNQHTTKIGMIMTLKFSKLLVSTLAIGFLAIATSSSEANAHEHTILEQNRICRAIENDQPRLSCYDRIDITLAQTNNEAQATTITRPEPDSSTPEVNRANPETFGLPEPKITTENAEQYSVRVVITSFAKNPYGEILFHTANGQIWHQEDRTRVFLKQGETFNGTISKSTFGGYRLKIDGKRPLIRVKRIR